MAHKTLTATISPECGKAYYTWAGDDPARKGLLFAWHAAWLAAIRFQDRIGTAYPDHCMQPGLCKGKGYCPRDPTCVD